MRVAYFDCFAGISGDMTLGALVDAGVDFAFLQEQLALLPLKGFELQAKKLVKQGIAATKVDVIYPKEHTHRHLQDIVAIINGSALSAGIKEKSIEIFTRLAQAEAKVHQKSIEQIHFHEVGAIDAIVDIVGSVIGLESLGVEKVYASFLHVGKGFVKCDHGIIPIPAPATLELLRGIPVYAGDVEKELVTPTGAAILSSYCQDFGPMPLMKVDSIGYGAGGYDLEMPNCVRLSLGEILADGQNIGEISFKDPDMAKEIGCFGIQEEVRISKEYIIETNIDDMNPEMFDYLFTLLLQAGAKDVFLQNIQMKKNRPAYILSVMTEASQIQKLSTLIFTETTTIGMRVRPITKIMLPYQLIEVDTCYGKAHIKVCYKNNEVNNIAPEYEDCRKIAEKTHLPLKQVYEEVKKEADRVLTGRDK